MICFVLATVPTRKTPIQNKPKNLTINGRFFMEIILKQKFTLGRFHANPWKMSPFEDPHGEWPPSPWRLLRAIMARSYQWERECGSSGEKWRMDFVRAFSTSSVSWNLPASSWRGPGFRQYHPVDFGWDPPNRTKLKNGQRFKIPGEKKYRSTLTIDNFWATERMGEKSDNAAVWWVIQGENWTEELFDWFDRSLGRITYFGRAESITDIQRVEILPEGVQINCRLNNSPSSNSVPVLAPALDATLEQVQTTTDEAMKRSVPPGALWLFASRPDRPPLTFRRLSRTNEKQKRPVSFLQFAIGTRVSPPRQSVVAIAERFRGRVIRTFLGCAWQQANIEQRTEAKLLTGKDAEEKPLRSDKHLHTYFGIFFDEQTDKASRLIVWRDRDHPFTEKEHKAILKAAEQELEITFKKKGPWSVRLVPLDSLVPYPYGFNDQGYRQWKTMTPYVPPRHVHDRRGYPKTGEEPETQVKQELERRGIDTSKLVIKVSDQHSKWVRAHQPRRVTRGTTNSSKRGYEVLLAFDAPVMGPIALGHSCHFGLGLFVPEVDDG